MPPRADLRLGRAVLALACTLLGGCARERRDPRPPAPALGFAAEAHLCGVAAARAFEAYQDNAYAMNQGKRLYQAFNCVGCHAHGGGAIGPALMDRAWIHGSEPEQIFETIARGRLGGMPAFGRKLAADQVWQLVAYVRSLAGLASMAAAPGRSDGMQVHPPENMLPHTGSAQPERLEAR